MKNLFQKSNFSKCFNFFYSFIDIITPVIPSTQIACDVMCVEHVYS